MEIVDVGVALCIVCHVIGNDHSCLGVGHTGVCVCGSDAEKLPLAADLGKILPLLVGNIILLDYLPSACGINTEGINAKSVAYVVELQTAFCDPPRASSFSDTFSAPLRQSPPLNEMLFYLYKT